MTKVRGLRSKLRTTQESVLLEIASRIATMPQLPDDDAAFLRDLAEHGCSGEGELRLQLSATFNRWADTRYAESVPLHGCEKAKVRATAAAFRNAADYVLDAELATQPGSGEGEECELSGEAVVAEHNAQIYGTEEKPACERCGDKGQVVNEPRKSSGHPDGPLSPCPDCSGEKPVCEECNGTGILEEDDEYQRPVDRICWACGEKPVESEEGKR